MLAPTGIVPPSIAGKTDCLLNLFIFVFPQYCPNLHLHLHTSSTPLEPKKQIIEKATTIFLTVIIFFFLSILIACCFIQHCPATDNFVSKLSQCVWLWLDFRHWSPLWNDVCWQKVSVICSILLLFFSFSIVHHYIYIY